ncbi:MAG: LysM peptidoglycan-binding domain-containing protein [Thermodesulfobacteria bacterium]|nr:LysM peptidoglycan-binding domain-containing protein [Thermodesulfobacteriota bacterium]
MKKLTSLFIIFLGIFFVLILNTYPVLSTTYIYYRVKRGDSLIKIAKKFGVSVEEIKKLNHLRRNRIYVGQRLKIKAKVVKKEKAQALPKGTQHTRYIYHIVRRGDTLAKIAKKYGVSIWEIKRMNHIRGNRIYVGERLLIKKIAVFKVQNKVVLPKKSEVEKRFDELETKYKSCIGSSKCDEKDWLSLIEDYRRLYLLHPDTKIAPKAILRVAEIYYRLYKNTNDFTYLNKAIKKYQLLINDFSKAPETEIAYAQLIRIYRKDLKDFKTAEDLRRSFQKKYFGKTLVTKKPALQRPILKLKKVVDVEPVTGEDYSRIIIDVSGDFQYKADVLKGDSKHPPRIYVDIFPATLSSTVPREIDIKDSHLEKIRVGQFNKNTVRVVLDLKSLTSYKIFKLKNPYQLILDLTGKEKKPAKGYINLARQLGLGIKTIVIDPGHGGKDSGAIGPDGLKEKDVVLKIAKMVKKLLEKRFHVRVILTRNRDKFVPLVQRPAIANSKKADLFISIHVNASPDKHARGIETYYLNFTTDPEAMRVAALENAVSNKGLSDLQSLVKAILANTKLSESRFLAEKIQHALVKTLSKVYPDTVDRGVKYAPFLVLVGTRMPAVLVEVSFITNPIEEKRLHSQKYLKLIAEGIVQGISDYIQSLKSMKHKFYEEKK